MRRLVAAGHLDPMPNGAVLSYLARCDLEAPAASPSAVTTTRWRFTRSLSLL
jgi:hypothetical protein